MKKNIIVFSLIGVLVFLSTACSSQNETETNNKSTNNQVENKNTETSKNGTNKAETNSTDPNKLADSKDEEKNKNKKLAHDFTLKDLDGNEVKLSDFKGKKVFLNFWATWCGPCRKEMPDINKIYQETKDSDLVILAINVNEGKETPAQFIKASGYQFSVLLDETMEVFELYGGTAYPTSVFINEDGYISDIKVGMMEYEEMMEYINKIS